MLLGARIGSFCGKRGGVPSGWVEVAYLESDGNQTIDIGVTIGDGETFSYEIDCQFKSGVSSVTGSGNGGGGSWWGSNGNIYNLGGAVSLNVDASSRNVVRVDKICVSSTQFRTKIAVGDKSTTRISSPSVGFDFCRKVSLFSTVDLSYKAYEKVYSFRALDGSLSLVPVRNSLTNEGAMCDVLTGTIYHNSGSGAFILGPDK